MLDSPLQRRPTQLGRVAAAGAVIAECPAELEHRLAVEVNAGETATADERAILSIAGHPLADAVPLPSHYHFGCPRLQVGGRPGSGPITHLRKAGQEDQIGNVVAADRRPDQPWRQDGVRWRLDRAARMHTVVNHVLAAPVVDRCLVADRPMDTP